MQSSFAHDRNDGGPRQGLVAAKASEAPTPKGQFTLSFIFTQSIDAATFRQDGFDGHFDGGVVAAWKVRIYSTNF